MSPKSSRLEMSKDTGGHRGDQILGPPALSWVLPLLGHELPQELAALTPLVKDNCEMDIP
jgi:hypothetical protein